MEDRKEDRGRGTVSEGMRDEGAGMKGEITGRGEIATTALQRSGRGGRREEEARKRGREATYP